MGKVKIPIKRIENPNARQVCFSKRRMGVFKKASELSIMCGAEIAIIVYSPAGKAFTFGSPDFDFVIDKYQNIPVFVNDKKVQKSWRAEQQYSSLLRELDVEKKRKEKLKRQERNAQVDSWCRRDIENLELHQLREFGDSLKEFKERIIQVVQEKEQMKFSKKALDEIEAELMSEEQPYQPAMWGEQVPFNAQSVMGSSSNNASVQDGKDWPFLMYENTYLPNEGIPSHLLIPHESCLPLSLEMSELQRVVMPADNRHLLSDD
ncbi:hypothetical protein SUGI_0837800 [Cryptomeria japonica]|uniref:agamous-like MADS-box protein AGL29 n=1 Tax=Cryptomeria japonica TaxID=3369 RepID=UPI002414C387|nr:agamous-like MADS-box protein AGL29 [Cryptomeria japonica]GLJ40585.1 hypothetical protein SUGI_0837800 [Cryptomeria japonica]